jgi:colicin import membrane protein
MADRRPDEKQSASERNSVLVSLQELRRQEDDRVKQEQAEAQARMEAERRAKEAAEQRARADEDERKRAEEERLRRLEEEKQSKIREEQLRLEDAERRARIDGEMKLQEQRLKMEIQARAGHKSPVKAIAGVTVALVAIGGFIGYRMYSQNKAEQAVLQQQLQEQRELARAAESRYAQDMAAIKKDRDSRLAAAKTEAERAQIKAESAARQAAAAATLEREKKVVKKAGKTGTTSADGKPGVNRPAIPGKREIDEKNLLDGL